MPPEPVTFDKVPHVLKLCWRCLARQPQGFEHDDLGLCDDCKEELMQPPGEQ